MSPVKQTNAKTTATNCACGDERKAVSVDPEIKAATPLKLHHAVVHDIGAQQCNPSDAGTQHLK